MFISKKRQKICPLRSTLIFSKLIKILRFFSKKYQQYGFDIKNNYIFVEKIIRKNGRFKISLV